MPFIYTQEMYIPIDGQTDIALPHKTPAAAIEVFLNSRPLAVDTDYIFLDDDNIQMLYQLSSYDIVVIKQEIEVGNRPLKIVADKGNRLFESVGVEKRLLENQKYVMSFEYKGETYSSTFYTKLSPMFSSIFVIRNDMGTMFDEITDDKLYAQIYLNSILALNIAGEDELSEIEAAMEENTAIPYYAKQYVRYRTEVDFINAIYLSISGGGETSEKSLGELSIKKSNSLGSVKNIEGMLKDLKLKLKYWEDILRGIKKTSPLVGAVRGGQSSPYPLTSPRRGTWGEGDE